MPKTFHVVFFLLISCIGYFLCIYNLHCCKLSVQSYFILLNSVVALPHRLFPILLPYIFVYTNHLIDNHGNTCKVTTTTYQRCHALYPEVEVEQVRVDLYPSTGHLDYGIHNVL